MRRHEQNPASVGNAPRNIRKGKLHEPRVSAALKQWLFEDKLTYKAIREKLLTEFGFRVSASVICKFYQKHSLPADEADHISIIRVELVIRSDRPVEVRISGETPGGGK